MPATVERQVAHKIWLASLHLGEFTKQEGWNPSYVKIGEKQVSRVQVIATVVSRFLSDDKNYGTLTLDDGSDTIRAKAFGPDVRFIESTRVGRLIRFIGKVKRYNDELYFAPEIIRDVDPNWAILHRLDLGTPPVVDRGEESMPAEQSKLQEAEPKVKKTKKKEVKEEPVEVAESKNVSTKILALIATIDKGEGAAMTEIVNKLGISLEEAKPKIAELLASGEIYEPRKGILKLL